MKTLIEEKKELHPRNRHRSRYDFVELKKTCPELNPFISLNQFNNLSIDFSDARAVKMLNKALLQHFYAIEFWDMPAGYLCPPIPGRADYIHYLADLLAEGSFGNKTVTVLDIGAGANCIYPIIGVAEYGWRFVATDIDPISIKSAKLIIQANPKLTKSVECRLQKNPTNIFTGVIKKGEFFDLTLCNPPFHASAEEAQASNQRKVHNLKIKSELNFAGQNNELWCEGGEQEFVIRMVEESALYAQQCYWFTSLVSKKTTLPAIYQALKRVNAKEVRTINMAQGQKSSRFVAWTFQEKV